MINGLYEENIHYFMREGFKEMSEKLEKPHNLTTSHSLTIAFIGGSVTAGAGASDPERTSYRARIYAYFRQAYPHISFRFIDAAIGGTDSTYGAFRLEEHVLRDQDVDLLFVEFAVNDAGGREMSVRAMEGIVRHAKRNQPHMDICFIYTASQAGYEAYVQTGKPQTNVSHHEEVANHYGLPSVLIANKIYQMIEEGRFRWDELSEDTVHPNDYGYFLYVGLLESFLDLALRERPHSSKGLDLPKPMDPYCFENGALWLPSDVKKLQGGRWVPRWCTDQFCNWQPPADVLLLEEAGSGFTFAFHGTAVGISFLAGMDTGNIEVSVDGSPFETVVLFDRYCSSFYRPKAILLADGIANETHTVEICMAKDKHEQSIGHNLHLLNLLVNGNRK
jgi:acyl-CoA thioesterase-1